MPTTFWISLNGQCTCKDISASAEAAMRSTGYKQVGFLKWLRWSHLHRIENQEEYDRSYPPGDKADEGIDGLGTNTQGSGVKEVYPGTVISKAFDRPITWQGSTEGHPGVADVGGHAKGRQDTEHSPDAGETVERSQYSSHIISRRNP